MGPCARSKPTAVAAVAALALVACSRGGDPSPPDAGLGGDGAVVQAFDPDRKGPAAPIEGAVAGGTVTASSDADLGGIHNLTMDPTEAFTPIDVTILSGLVTRSLTQYVYDAEQGTMVVVPDIATDLGTPNEDFTEWTFTIRDGVKFEDGTEVTAEDVAYGVKRSLDRRTFPAGPYTSNDYFLDDDKYQGLYTTGTQYAGVVVEGDTLTIKMERPFPDMPYWGTYPAMGPIPERGSEPDRYALHPLATGPYKIAEYTPGESLTLVRNDQWDPDTDPARHAYPDRYEFDFTVPQKQIDATILGDSVQGRTTLSLSSVLDYRRAQRLARVALGTGGCTYAWHPDYRKIPEIRVRQAIGYAFPYQAHASMSGKVAPAFGASYFLPGTPGRQDYAVLETEPGHTDPDKAKALLKEAGYAPGEFELIFPYISDAEQSHVELKDLVVEAFEAAGFKVTPFPTKSESFETLRHDPEAPINLRPFSWCPNWPSGGSWIPTLFGADGAAGAAQFAEPAVDAEMERIAKLPIDQQPAAWGALDRSIMSDYYPAIVTRYDAVALPHGSKIGGMNIDKVWRMPTWKDIYVLH